MICSECRFPQIFLSFEGESVVGVNRDCFFEKRKNFYTYGGVRNISVLATYDFAYNYQHYVYRSLRKNVQNSEAYNTIIKWHLLYCIEKNIEPAIKPLRQYKLEIL